MTKPSPSLDDLMQRIERAAKIDKILTAVRPGDWVGRLNAYRRAYDLAQPWLAAGECLPYAVDVLMTPIELAVWQQLRYWSLPFYPQYPIGRYTADFADPIRRISIECDGYAYHQPERDAKRDRDLNELGWRVIRIPGWRCVRPETDPEGAGPVIRRLAAEYGRPEPLFRDVPESDE